jgi:L-threonylcarbamoyladenylate synthase
MNIRRINAARPEGDIIKEGSRILIKGGVIVAPTETKYGLLGRIDNPGTLEKIYKLKKRNYHYPTAIFIASLQDMTEFGLHNNISERISKKFLPGPMTIILKAKSGFSEPIAVDGKIGFRLSSSPVIGKLLGMTNLYLTATSANLSGENNLETIGSVANLFSDQIDLYLDAGPLGGDASTVVDCSDTGYRILREGRIRREEIDQSLEIN